MHLLPITCHTVAEEQRRAVQQDVQSQQPLQECQAVTWEWGFVSKTAEHLSLGVPDQNMDVRLYRSLLEDNAEALDYQ